MGKIEDEFVDWAKKEDRWPLLFLLTIPPAYVGFKGFFSLSFASAISSPQFLSIAATIFIVTGVLFWAIRPNHTRLLKSCILIATGLVVFFIAGARQRHFDLQKELDQAWTELDNYQKAVSLATRNVEDAFKSIERTYLRAQIMRFVNNYETEPTSPWEIKPLLDGRVITLHLNALSEIGKHVTALQGLTKNEVSISQYDIIIGRIPALSGNPDSANDLILKYNQEVLEAIDQLAIVQDPKKMIPRVIKTASPSVDKLCKLLAKDIEHAGILIQTSYKELSQEHDLFIRKHTKALDPISKKLELEKLVLLTVEARQLDQLFQLINETLRAIAYTHADLEFIFSRDYGRVKSNTQILIDKGQRIRDLYNKLEQRL